MLRQGSKGSVMPHLLSHFLDRFFSIFCEERGSEIGRGPVSFVLDLRIAHERWGSSSDPRINGHLRYLHDIDWSLNEVVTEKIRKYRTDYNNNPLNTISCIPGIPSTSGRIHTY